MVSRFLFKTTVLENITNISVANKKLTKLIFTKDFRKHLYVQLRL